MIVPEKEFIVGVCAGIVHQDNGRTCPKLPIPVLYARTGLDILYEEGHGKTHAEISVTAKTDTRLNIDLVVGHRAKTGIFRRFRTILEKGFQQPRANKVVADI